MLGTWDFDVLREIRVRAPVLIPRPETEELVALADGIAAALTGYTGGSRLGGARDVCALLRDPLPRASPAHFLEVGCGSGAVSLALLARASARAQTRADAHPQSTCALVGTAIDISADATSLTSENAAAQGVAPASLRVLHCALEAYTPPAPRAHALLLCNPPYIPSPDMPGLQAEVLHWEDVRALEGGAPGGLGVTLRLLEAAAEGEWLAPGGIALLETHTTHPRLLFELLAAGREEGLSSEVAAAGARALDTQAAAALVMPAFTVLPASSFGGGGPLAAVTSPEFTADEATFAAVHGLAGGPLGSRLRAFWRFVGAFSDFSGRPRFVALQARATQKGA